MVDVRVSSVQEAKAERLKPEAVADTGKTVFKKQHSYGGNRVWWVTVPV